MNKFFTKLFLYLLNGISRLSWKKLYKLSDIFRFLIFDIAQYRKDVILINLRNSFPSYSQEKIDQIARKYYGNFTDITFETIKLKSISEKELTQRLDVAMDPLHQCLKKHDTVVVVAGHLGNWEMLNLYASLTYPYQMVVVYHELASDAFEKWFHVVRSRFGTEMVPMQDAIAKAVEPKKKPTIFILINDQSPIPTKAYWTRFLHQETGIFRGVETIARRLNAPVYYMGVMKNELKRGFYKTHFKLITETPKYEPKNMIIQRQLEFLEEDIVSQPDNWLWSHRRWKHRRPENLPLTQLSPEIQRE